jgi:parallel beta-helix repeat protein
MRRIEYIARSVVAAAALLIVLPGAAMFSLAFAATCGGAVVCQCGDTVVEDYTMTSDLGPCPLVLGGDTIGLRVGSGVTLNCGGHAIIGPPDGRRSEFGIRVGTSSAIESDVVIRNCRVTGFWWGIYVQSAKNVVIKKNHIHENGWKDNTENGTGYGLDIANSADVIVRNNTIADNGDEGIHLSHSMSPATTSCSPASTTRS